MADISAFRIDSQKKQEGEWVRLGEEYLDVEVKVRGLTDRYHDRVAARSRAAARSLGGDTSKLPTSVARRIVIDAVCDELLLDVRNLKNGDEVITIDAFKQLLHHEDYYDLVLGVLRATQQVGQQRMEDLQEAVGN